MRSIALAILLTAWPFGTSHLPLTELDDPPSLEIGEFDPGKAGFSIRFKAETSPYRVIAAFVLPEEELEIEAMATGSGFAYEAAAEAGVLVRQAPNRWIFRSPGGSGVYPITVRQLEPADSIRLNVFVMVPFTAIEGEYLNGYRIGSYPDRPLRGLAIYKKPRGFIEVTPQNRDTPLSPHFKLSQFLCKQASDWPKYVVLQERLLLKLERILEVANQRGYQAGTLTVMSGYRTPYYNRAIGNVRYSRHVWGGAADIYIDESPRDGMMDDLNHDGRIDYRDAGVLYQLVDEMYGQPWYAPFVGGLGRYKKTANHGPFVHVDVRGFRARWGT